MILIFFFLFSKSSKKHINSLSHTQASTLLAGTEVSWQHSLPNISYLNT